MSIVNVILTANHCFSVRLLKSDHHQVLFVVLDISLELQRERLSGRSPGEEKVKYGQKWTQTEFFQKPILFLENFPHTEVQLLSLTYPKFKPAESDEANAVNFKILRGVSPQANVNSVLGLLKP